MLLLCSNTLAWAAATTVHIPLSDELPLTGAQERLIWQRLGKPSAAAARASAAFEPSLYGAVPSSLVLHALPASVTRQIPMARGYKYTSVGGTLLIVNPSDGRIVDIIGP
jgi:hypothetical protein